MNNSGQNITPLAIAILNWNGQSWLEKFLPTVIQHSPNTEMYAGSYTHLDVYKRQTVGSCGVISLHISVF